jgi:hypothetical protein
LAAEDRATSPHTGWTRKHWEALADHLLVTATAFRSRQGAYYEFPGSPSKVGGARRDGLEGFARTFVLAAARMCHAPAEIRTPLVERYMTGLVAGTTADGPEAWPAPADGGQEVAEAGLISLALHMSYDHLWAALGESERQTVLAWLRAAAHRNTNFSNWLLFPALTASFLERATDGGDGSRLLDRQLDRLEALYRADGWYTDGLGENFDYYNAWAFHIFTLAIARYARDEQRTDRFNIYRERSAEFLEQHMHFFARDGAPVFFGRTLTYRFAVVGCLWAAALAEVPDVQPGLLRRGASGTLRYFVENGAVGNAGLSIGWHESFVGLAQDYSGPASPWWAAVGFLGLALPPDHPAWTDVEQPLPVERGDFVRALPAPGLLLQGTHADGIVRLVNHRSDHFPWRGTIMHDAHYRKIAYSTQTAPAVGALRAADGEVVLTDADDDLPRTRIHEPIVIDKFGGSVHYPREWSAVEGRPAAQALRRLGVAPKGPFPRIWKTKRTAPFVAFDRPLPQWDPRVETVSFLHDGCEVRVHHVSSSRVYTVSSGGFALGAARDTAEETDGWRVVRGAQGMLSCAAPLYGFDTASTHKCGETALSATGAWPVLSGRSTSGEAIFVGVFALSRALPPTPTVRVERRRVWLKFRDATAVVIHLVEPQRLERPLDGLDLDRSFRFARWGPGSAPFLR